MLEVTERQAVHAEAQVVAAIARLRATGVTFAVDDVGAGHAGLGQLALVRPEYLKLDRSIVRGLQDAPDRVTFVRSLAQFMEGSHTRVIAEGLETDADLAAVRDVGVGLAQGFCSDVRPRTWSSGWPSDAMCWACRDCDRTSSSCARPPRATRTPSRRSTRAITTRCTATA